VAPSVIVDYWLDFTPDAEARIWFVSWECSESARDCAATGH